VSHNPLPVNDGWINLDQLAKQVDWSHLSEMEKLLVAGLQPDYNKLIQEVRDNPALAQYRWGSGTTLLHVAANDVQPELAKLLVALSAGVNAMDVADGTPLHSAAGSGNIEIVDLLLQHNASIHALDGRGCTPLYKAAISHDNTICRRLLEYGATPQDEYTRQYICEIGSEGVSSTPS